MQKPEPLTCWHRAGLSRDALLNKLPFSSWHKSQAVAVAAAQFSFRLCRRQLGTPSLQGQRDFYFGCQVTHPLAPSTTVCAGLGKTAWTRREVSDLTDRCWARLQDTSQVSAASLALQRPSMLPHTHGFPRPLHQPPRLAEQAEWSQDGRSCCRAHPIHQVSPDPRLGKSSHLDLSGSLAGCPLTRSSPSATSWGAGPWVCPGRQVMVTWLLGCLAVSDSLHQAPPWEPAPADHSAYLRAQWLV